MKKLRWNLRSFERPNRNDDCRLVTEVSDAISNELNRLSQGGVLESEVFRQQVALRLHDKLAEITDLTAGKLVFSSTETWRTGYQQVLESADAKRYLSVAWSVPRTTGVEPLESGAFASTPCLSITGFTSTGF